MKSILTGIVAVFAIACSQPFTDARGLRYSANTTASNDSLTTVVTMTNTGRRNMQLTIGGGCPVTIVAYAGESTASGSPAWDQSVWRGQTNVACTAELQVLVFSPGEAKEFRSAAAISDILGDSLPTGTYSFVARTSLQQGGISIPAGQAALDSDPHGL